MAGVRHRAAPEPRPSARHNCRSALSLVAEVDGEAVPRPTASDLRLERDVLHFDVPERLDGVSDAPKQSSDVCLSLALRVGL